MTTSTSLFTDLFYSSMLSMMRSPIEAALSGSRPISQRSSFNLPPYFVGASSQLLPSANAVAGRNGQRELSTQATSLLLRFNPIGPSAVMCDRKSKSSICHMSSTWTWDTTAMLPNCSGTSSCIQRTSLTGFQGLEPVGARQLHPQWNL